VREPGAPVYIWHRAPPPRSLIRPCLLASLVALYANQQIIHVTMAEFSADHEIVTNFLLNTCRFYQSLNADALKYRLSGIVPRQRL